MWPLAGLAFLLLAWVSPMASAQTPQFNYLLHCGGCHIEDGSGMGEVVPDLNEEMGFFASFPEGRSYLVRVPGSAHSPLSDGDLAQVLNWMLRTFAAEASAQPYTEAEVTANRRIRMNDVHAVRKQLLKQKPDTVTPAAITPVAAAPALSPATAATPATPPALPAPLSAEQQQAFGEALFFDTSLSRHGNQACASCHDPGQAFSDPRSLSTGAGASIGSDGASTGHRNAPALTYVAATPALTLQDLSQTAPPSQHRTPTVITTTPADAIRGGFFWDGREPTLEHQVLTPFVNNREMALDDLSELADKVAGSERYQPFLNSQGVGSQDVGNKSIGNKNIGSQGKSPLQQSQVLERIAQSLAAYLRSDVFNSYDSRYDRFVRGEINASAQELAGMGLFFSPGFTNCASCHQSSTAAYASGELFSNHRYENIGTPINRALLGNSSMGADFRDPGLAMNPALTADFAPDDVNGRFKVPSLRNVAVTAPYMHNGAFSELDTVMRFYNHYNESGGSGQINPETGQAWAESSNPDGVVINKLQAAGFPLSERQLAALTAFMRMLTDQRYEHLLP